MEANAVSLLALFEKKMRLEVPLFQRQYVWSREQQWEPLWEDIERKFVDYLEGRRDAPVHFLGAMVLDQKQTPSTHVERRQVIDGQQRLTTLQIFLAAFRDFCRERGCDELAKESDGYTFNKGMMPDPQVDKYKIWPTQLDRPQFMDAVGAGSRAEVLKRHPISYKRRKPLPRPRMIEAYLFFHDRLAEFFEGAEGDRPLAAEMPLANRLEECFHALKNALQVVAIDLQQGDDAQVIFETLNARGEPLLPADLLRNFIFLRAARRGEPQEALYEEFWRRFDDPFWRQEVRQGRLLRPRSDLFMQHFLASRQTIDIPVKHLFVEYKFWIERKRPFATVRDELATLARQGEDFRRIIEPKSGDVLFPLFVFLDAFDIRTIYPLLLAVLNAHIAETELGAMASTIESYLLRRAVCGMTTKNYNRIFLALTRTLGRDGMTNASLSRYLRDQSGESSEWPSDAAFAESWRTVHAYRALSNPKVVHILKRINDTYLSPKMEALIIDGQVTVEHILPQNWTEHWPLQDGTKGMDTLDLLTASDDDPRAVASRGRNAALQTFGNLTILTQALNSAVSNGPWPLKRDELKHSLLPINQQLRERETWDESTISTRSEALLQRALKVWPRPAESVTAKSEAGAETATE